MTLIELVVVMALLGIISVVAAVALRGPIDAYAATKRRAELTDLADTALRRMGRDIRRSLPNSPRVANDGTTVFLEFLLTKTGGRYRAQDGNSGNVLDFSLPDSAFDSLGVLPNQTVAANDVLVVFNLFATGSNHANAYTFNTINCSGSTSSPTCNSARVSGTAAAPTGTNIQIDARQFPFGSPGNRFYVVEGPVSYICTPGPVNAAGDGTGTLQRRDNYAIPLSQPVAAVPGAPVLANFVTDCSINYDPLILNQSLGLISITLELTRANESVRLYHEVHVSNIP